MKVVAANLVVVCYGMVLSEVFGNVGAAASPENDKLALGESILDPVESHINRFEVALFDCFVGNASGAGIVRGVRRGRLWIAHQNESYDEDGGVLGVV